MATHAAIVVRRAVIDRDLQAVMRELVEIHGTELAAPFPKGKQPEHQANNEREEKLATLRMIVPVARARKVRLESIQDG